MELTIQIPDDQADRLSELQTERNVSPDQLIQEALASYLPPRRKGHLLDYFGILKGRVEEGQAFQDRMRSEWDRE